MGPTGVGKTTTIAKLAAGAARKEGKRVALITVDTYRIGAVQQLETYARLLGMPLMVASTPDEIRQARARYASYDLVLVDTIGRPPGSAGQIAEQLCLLDAGGVDEVHLCLDAGSSSPKLEAAVEGFRALGPTHCLLTKLDEAAPLGSALDAVAGSGLPLSYLATGQRVPEDLAAASRPEIERWLGGEGR